MLKLLNCAHGHYWEKPINNGVDQPPEVCPDCGQAAESMPFLDLAPTEAQPIAHSEAPSPPPLRDKEGRPIIAGYGILSDLGKAPSGVHLYKARQAIVNRIVLLKVVFAKDDPRQFAWGGLRGEASALGRLNHPNIVQILEAGERERQLFYNAVEHIEGPTLADLLSGKPLPIRQAVPLMETLARAVHHAHQKNILHRNLKPASILLARESARGQDADTTALAECIPKIADFGLARRPVEGDVSDVELQGEMPCYLAPEQAWGRAKEIGPATDVYALGAILYELIGGRPPFCEATATEMLDAIQSREPPMLSRLHSRVSRNLEAICRKCLAKQPRLRYAAALDLAEDLRRFQDGRPVKARAAGNVERMSKWLRRYLRPVALVLLSLWAGISLTALSSKRDRAPSYMTAPRPMNYTPRVAFHEEELRLVREREAAGNYVRYLLLAQRALDDGDTQRCQEMLLQCPPDLRHWEWRYLWDCLMKVRNNRAEYAADLPILCMDLSRDGRYLVAGGGKEQAGESGPVAGEVSVWDLQTQALLHHWKMNVPVRGAAFSPDSKHLALIGGSDKQQKRGSWIEVRILRTGAPSFAKSFRDDKLISLAYSSDPRNLLTIADSGLVHVLRADSGDAVQTHEVWFLEPKPVGSFTRMLPIPSPAQPGRLAVVSSDGEQIKLADWQDRSTQIDLAGTRTTCYELAYNERTRMFAAAGLDSVIRLWDVRIPQQPKTILCGHRGGVMNLSFSSDGQRLASYGADGTVRIWNVGQGIELLRLSGFKDVSCLRFRRTQEPADDMGWRDLGLHEIDRLAIAHGNKVTVIEPSRGQQ